MQNTKMSHSRPNLTNQHGLGGAQTNCRWPLLYVHPVVQFLNTPLVKSWSIVLLSVLNPVCSSSSALSTYSFILFCINLKTYRGMLCIQVNICAIFKKVMGKFWVEISL